LRILRKMRRECLREREKGWSEHEQVLYLALRRGVLLGEAQMRWLDEVDVFGLDRGGSKSLTSCERKSKPRI
jgi:hypothetical protein